MFIVGAVFVFGGSVICKQAFEDAKNVLESTVFGLAIVAVGLLLCVWSIFGPPG
ncbi:MAG: hypothetical protein IPM23_26635 [Candidatus Melainabacteria bacterium]|nr:hypothetical protein [Candidatus Melainabacteria bacterium]